MAVFRICVREFQAAAGSTASKLQSADGGRRGSIPRKAFVETSRAQAPSVACIHALELGIIFGWVLQTANGIPAQVRDYVMQEAVRSSSRAGVCGQGRDCMFPGKGTNRADLRQPKATGVGMFWGSVGNMLDILHWHELLGQLED